MPRHCSKAARCRCCLAQLPGQHLPGEERFYRREILSFWVPAPRLSAASLLAATRNSRLLCLPRCRVCANPAPPRGHDKTMQHANTVDKHIRTAVDSRTFENHIACCVYESSVHGVHASTPAPFCAQRSGSQQAEPPSNAAPATLCAASFLRSPSPGRFAAFDMFFRRFARAGSCKRLSKSTACRMVSESRQSYPYPPTSQQPTASRAQQQPTASQVGVPTTQHPPNNTPNVEQQPTPPSPQQPSSNSPQPTAGHAACA